MGKYIKLLSVLALMMFPVVLVSCEIIDNATGRINDLFFDEELADSAVAKVELFFDSLVEKDYEAAYSYIEKKDARSYEDFIEEFEDVTDIISVEINWVEVNNNLAEVGIDIIDSYDGDEKIYKDLVISLIRKEEEDWKIVFWN